MPPDVTGREALQETWQLLMAPAQDNRGEHQVNDRESEGDQQVDPILQESLRRAGEQGRKSTG